ncbi:hypothetical protein Dxin01_02186 [Deinococcus xinjiangensis]|uniref:Fluoroacetyl-CoA-specific thioesterase-like domain-containing protein n=1 Tax=Deinococcus xinjiangensis TaxID=457454 RepID=A0ABP9VB21_9DEIO
MRPIPAGFVQTLTLTVTAEMTVDFAELGKVHPVYATYWMAKHFEEAGRKIILPYLEEGEGGIGSQVEVNHTASALPEMQVTITATFERQEGRRVYATMRAINELGDEIGTGRTTQVILPQTKIDTNFEQLRGRWETHRQAQGQ